MYELANALYAARAKGGRWGGAVKRRDAIAGIASVGTLVGSVGLLRNGPPTFGDESGPQSDTGDDANDGPTEVQTIDAGPSEAGTQELPVEGQVSVLNFFVTYCGYCKRQMSPLAEAREQIDDDVRFLSITTQSLDNALDEDELREWWDEHDGTWDVGYGSTRDFRREHNVLGFPVTLVLDEDGEAVLNEGASVIGASTIVDAVESVAGSDVV
ncbi:TlpA family protein disulfide reductase [Halostagnicola bangensis]